MPLRARPATQDRAGRRGLDDGHLLLAVIGLLVTAVILNAPAFYERREFSGRRAPSREAGYVATVDRLAELELLTLRQLPALQPGRPERDSVMVDSRALESLGNCQATSLLARVWQAGRALRFWSGDHAEPKPACAALFENYRASTYLAGDMLRASEDLWRIDAGRVLGLRDDAHALRESAFASVPGAASLAFAYEPASSQRWTLVDPSAGESMRLEGSGGMPCRGFPFAVQRPIHCLDRGVLIEIPAGAQVQVNGLRMTPSGTTGLLLLAAGDVIGVDGDPRRLQLLEQPRALSELAPGGQRVRHPAFTAQAAQIPDTALARDLQTTVRPDLQIRVQEALEARLAPLVPNVPGEAKRNMRGAVLLMDGLTGAIAAAATFPARPEHLPIDERDNPARLRRLELNQNFELLPTGSAAKVPFAASLAKADPGLLAVTLRYADTHCVDWRGFLRTGEEKDCSRAASSQKIRDHGNGGSNIVTFRSFITHSNNFYAMNLLRLGRQRSGLEGPWLSNFRRFACAHPAGINPLMDESCPVYPWADARDPYRGAALAGLRPVFRENEIQRDPKNKFFEAIRGSIDFSWTTPQLAQAYARLLTGRGVTPRLVSGPVAGQADAFALQSAVWQAVRDGMHGVVTTGTASNYFRQWSPTPATYLLGKTGTPTLADGSDGSVFVLALAQTPGGGDPAEPTAICALKLIVVNFEFKPPRLASGFARDLLADPGVLAWATRPCGARR